MTVGLPQNLNNRTPKQRNQGWAPKKKKKKKKKKHNTCFHCRQQQHTHTFIWSFVIPNRYHPKLYAAGAKFGEWNKNTWNKSPWNFGSSNSSS